MAAPLSVDIVGSDRVLWSGTAERVIAPTTEGEIGLLRNHEPILSLLQQGTVRVHGSDAGEQVFAISGGFISFDHNVVTVVVDVAGDDAAA